MEIEPHWIYAYWEITSRDIQEASHRLCADETGSQWVLRFYDVTGLEFHGDSARDYFDVSIDLAPGNWYVNLWSGGKSYYAEVGLRSADGRFVSLCRSNAVEVPSVGPPTEYEPGWLKVEGVSDQSEGAPEPESLARARSSKSGREEAPFSVAPAASDQPAAGGTARVPGGDSSHSLYFSQAPVSHGALSSESVGSFGLGATRVTERKREMREANERKPARTRRREDSEKV
jgi:hypothetical protein